MQRIVIVGPSASGKSTFAQALGEKLQLPVFHLDQYFFNDHWQEVQTEELVAKVETILAENDRWIIEGNYNSTLPSRLTQSDTVFFLDYPRRVYMTRLFKRYRSYLGKVRPDMAANCPERIDFTFIRYVWNFPKRRKQLLDLVTHYGKPLLIVFSHPKNAKNFIKSLEHP